MTPPRRFSRVHLQRLPFFFLLYLLEELACNQLKAPYHASRFLWLVLWLVLFGFPSPRDASGLLPWVVAVTLQAMDGEAADQNLRRFPGTGLGVWVDRCTEAQAGALGQSQPPRHQISKELWP